MWPLVAAAAIPAIASAFGQSSANKTNIRLSREGMAFEGDQAAKQMQFQERMSGTSYQRATEDMRLAGINPMLAYMQGGASTPGGAAASGAAATVQDVVGPAVASAQHARRLNQELRSMEASASASRETARREGHVADREQAMNAALGFQRTGSGSVRFDMSMPNLTDRVRAETSEATSAAETARLSLPSQRRASAAYTGRWGWELGVMDRLFGRGMLSPLGMRR